MIIFTKRERKVLHNALNSRAVDVMRLINDSYVMADPDQAEEIRDSLYDEMDEIEDLLDKLRIFED